MGTLELEGACGLDLVVAEAAFLAGKGHDDNLAKIGNPGQEKACHTL